MKKTNLKVISRLGNHQDKALLVELPKELASKLEVSRKGDVNLVDLMKLAILAEAGDLNGDFRITPTRINENLSNQELWNVYRIAFDSSIALKQRKCI